MDAFYIVDDGVDVKRDLRNRLTGLVKHLFGNTVDYQFMLVFFNDSGFLSVDHDT